MSQSLLYHAFGVREGYEYQKTEYVEGRVEFHLRAREELLQCPECGHGPARRRGSRWRRIRTVPIGLKEVVLVTEVPRCQCQKCGSDLRCLPPFAPAYAHYSLRLAQMVCTLHHWMTLSEVASVSHLHWASVKEIVKSDLFKRYKKIPLRHVRYLAVDFISRRAQRQVHDRGA